MSLVSETEIHRETRDLKPKARLYQFENVSVEPTLTENGGFVWWQASLKTNRAPFPVSAKAFGSLSANEATELASALLAAARKVRHRESESA